MPCRFFWGGFFPFSGGRKVRGRKEGFLASVAFVAFVGFLDLVACVPSVATWLLWLVWLMFFRGFLVFYGFRGFYGFEVVECFNMSLPFLPVKVVCNRKQRQNWRKRIE